MRSVKVYYSGNGYLVEMNGEAYSIPADGTEVRVETLLPRWFPRRHKEIGIEDCPVPVKRCVAGLACFRHKLMAKNRGFWRETLTITGGKATVLDMAG